MKEKAAISKSFHHRQNLLTGPNRVGKSSLIKSIMHALGANSKINPRWTDAAPHLLLKVEINKEIYYFYRQWDGPISIFDSEKQCLGKDLQVQDELSTLFSELLLFNLQLTSRKTKVLKQAPPSFKLLPFYISQDSGWQDPHEGFSDLGKFTGWKDEFANYHAGITTNEYYSLQKKLSETNLKLKEELASQKEILSVQKVLEKS